MNLKYVSEIVKNMETSPYNCILIDGPWGIGKSYEVKKAIDENTIYVSAFGVETTDELYQSLMWELINGGDGIKQIVGSVAELGKSIASKLGFGDVSGILPNAKTVVSSLLKHRKKDVTVIIDDIERLSPNLELQDFLGVVEFLHDNELVKIVMVANLEELTDIRKEVFSKHNEKVVDKIYSVNEFSEDIDWEELNVDSKLVINFIEKHNLSNLRTIKKAGQFHNDVLNKISIETNRVFDETVVQICYAIVIEDIDQIYKKQLEEDKRQMGDKFDKSFDGKYELDNFIYRISKRYLTFRQEMNGLLAEIYNYYKDNTDISESVLVSSMELISKMGEKPNFYKSDDELRETIDAIKINFEKCDDLNTMISNADIVMYWSEVLGDDINAFSETVKLKLERIIDLMLEAEHDVESILDRMGTSSKCLKQILTDSLEELPVKRLECFTRKINKELCSGNYDETVRLIKIYENLLYSVEEGVQKAYLKRLFVEELLPVGSIEEAQSECIRRILKLSRKFAKNDVIVFLEESKELHKADKAFVNRINTYERDYLN